MRALMVALVRSLIKNGVKAPAEAISFVEDNGRFTGDVSTVILDFSEHDKMVAEEKDNRIAELEEDLNRLTMDLKNRMGQIYELREKNTELDRMRKSWLDTAVKLSEERFDLKRQIEMLETNGNESCKNEPISDCCRPSIEWYEDRHQSDCIRINQLLTTIDVLTERYQKLREIHGL